MRQKKALRAVVVTLIAGLLVAALPGTVVSSATFPFYDGFESGSLGSSWAVETTNEGRVVVDDTYPYAGTYSLLLDDYRDDSTKSIAAA
ncbi:MAG: hypothetical protein ACP5JJ_03270, partial [Anaerolineae bacterium]